MRILALDSSAMPASAAIYSDGRILGEYFINTKQTHSETLMPMVESLLKLTKTQLPEIDLFAVTNGPGSFTGVRIGVSCIKGLAFVNNTPCCPVSTLESIAYNGAMLEGKTICAVMDARREQVYNALFEVRNKKIIRLCDDRAVMIDALREDAAKYGKDMILMGDGADLCYDKLKDTGVSLAAESDRYQNAASVAFVAAEKILKGVGTVSPNDLLPKYLRIPQAERELSKKMKEEGKL